MWTRLNNVFRSTEARTPPSQSASRRDSLHPAAAMVAITKRNSTKSPLLRLPGEIRNMIYEYATGYYKIYHTAGGHLMVGPIDPWEWRHAFVEFPSVPCLLSLTLICRQIYLEARLHVFANNTFDTKNFFYFRNRVNKLTTAQKKAITTITCAFDCMDKLGFNVFRLNNTIEYSEHFLVKPYLDVLPSFTGLRRVVMDSSNMKTRSRSDAWKTFVETKEDSAMLGVRRFFHNDNIVIEFV